LFVLFPFFRSPAENFEKKITKKLAPKIFFKFNNKIFVLPPLEDELEKKKNVTQGKNKVSRVTGVIGGRIRTAGKSPTN
jgi:hypothetical protein